MTYIHGIQSLATQSGTRSIKEQSTSLICILGTAPKADATKYPLDAPVLINAASNRDHALLGSTGTLPKAVDGIRDQIGAKVCIIRIDHSGTPAELQSRALEKTQLIRGVESVVGEKPKILIAPSFLTITTDAANPVITEMLSIAESLRAFVIADGPNITNTDAIQARNHYGSKRLLIVDPGVKVWDTKTDSWLNEFASPRIAGLFAKNDAERSAFHTPSNMLITGIGGTTRPIQYATSDSNSEHNLLNKNQIGTIVNANGYRFLGTDTCDITDSNNRFINSIRGADAIDDALESGIQWALDRNITQTFIDDVTTSIQGYLENRIAQGDLLPGSKITADPELNTQTAYSNGQVYFNYDYATPTPAVHITIKRQVNYDLAKGIFNL